MSEPTFKVDMSEVTKEYMIAEAFRLERKIAEAVVRGDKFYDEPGWVPGTTTRYVLTTRWWQIRRRRKILRLAHAALTDKEEGE